MAGIMPEYDWKLLAIGLVIHLSLIWYFLTDGNARHTLSVADGMSALITGGLA